MTLERRCAHGELVDPLRCRWRLGATVPLPAPAVEGRAILMQCGADPDDGDPPIGVLDSEPVAVECVNLHNRYLDALNP